jgi:hypothetical protein
MPTNQPTWVNSLFHQQVFFVVYFIALWVLTSYGISLLSGWGTLSHRFRNSGAFYSYQWPSQSIRMRALMNYNNCANLGADQDGLYMAVFPVFRIGHAPLFIPWSEVQVVRGDTGLIFKKQKLLLGREELVPLFVSLSLAEKIKEAARQRWPMETIGI